MPQYNYSVVRPDNETLEIVCETCKQRFACFVLDDYTAAYVDARQRLDKHFCAPKDECGAGPTRHPTIGL